MTEMPKICRGCFTEWEEGNAACPNCGWEPGEQYDRVFDWTPGEVFEKRYLLGMLFCSNPDTAVWRIYDTVLGVSYLALRVFPEDDDSLYLSAKKIKKSKDCFQGAVRLMAAKSVGLKRALLFSIEETEQNREVLKHALQKEIQLEEAFEPPDVSGCGRKKEQELIPGTILKERYQVLECIGIGGFGMIYLCNDIALRRLVAVKEYFPEEWAEREEQYVSIKKSRMAEAYRFGLESFYLEAKLMAKFIHTPHVVTICDVMEANDTAYLVMDYIAGISIGREMRAGGYQPYLPKEAAEILFPVTEALCALHEEKIIHCDVSPGNIMRSENGEIYLIDMGAAKYALTSRPILSAAFLKPDYAAPEQYRTAKSGIPGDEGPWTDVYALGATAYYLLTGAKPPDVMQRLSGKRKDVALPKRCRLRHKKQWLKFFNRAMALEIRERMGSVVEFREEMEKLLK